MLFISLMLATGSLPLISGLPVPSSLSDRVEKVSSTHYLQERDGSTYTVYGGTGEVSDGWPSMDNWVSSFETMFENNMPILQGSCAQFGVQDNSEDEINDMSSSIQSVASSTGIDPRFIFAIIMEETNGCVRAPTTNYGVRNPGLMQDHNGAGTCNEGGVKIPCPASEITQMIQDGSAGTASGDGLKQCLAKADATDVSMYYKAARIYNSGSIAAGGNLGAGIATACYVSDIANRLTNWFSGPSGCDPSTIAELTGTSTTVSKEPTTGNQAGTTAASSSAQTSSAASQTTVASIIATIAPSSTVIPTTTSAAAISTTTSITSPIESSPAKDAIAYPSASAQVYAGATSTCQQWYTVQPGDYCILIEQKFGVSMTQLMSWNTGLDADCSNLWLAYQYCVKA